jgi:hypothetical protein
VQVADLPRTLSVVADREDTKHLGASGHGDGGDEFPKPLLDLGKVHQLQG